MSDLFIQKFQDAQEMRFSNETNSKCLNKTHQTLYFPQLQHYTTTGRSHGYPYEKLPLKDWVAEILALSSKQGFSVNKIPVLGDLACKDWSQLAQQMELFRDFGIKPATIVPRMKLFRILEYSYSFQEVRNF